jgi:predicted ATP-dependent endonuclease of OLD family
MKLNRVQIKNFRSVKNQDIVFEDGCQILVGINEAGKSNILRALSLLDPKSAVSPSDIRIERADEEPDEESHVRFVFKLSASEIEEIYQNLSVRFHTKDIDQPIIQLDKRKFTLRQFCERNAEGLHTVDINKNIRASSYWSLTGKYEVIGGWRRIKLPTEGISAETMSRAGTVQIVGVDFVNAALYKAIDGTFLSPISAKDIHELIGREIVKMVDRELPQCVYWRYTEKNILPSRIDSNAFAADPDTCVPLRSMFELAGYADSQIGEVITKAKTQAPHIYTNLLNKVSLKATDYLRSVWKDHKISIELGKNGDLIEPIIKDEQVALNFENRSDGFKRFVSFLLIIAAKVHTDTLTDNLIIIDEPEIALHPAGARSLMKELIEIGKKNYVVYSTHSIFMIDKEKIDRHLIVEKKNETTAVKRAEKSHVQDEEVLYNAIGFSLFEALKEKNIIFEGWADKRLFEVARLAYMKGDAEKKKLLNPLGLTFAEGAKDVRNIAKFLELADRGCLILSDADNAGKQYKSAYEKERGYGKWLTYSDIFGNDSYMTAEDFVKTSALVARARKFRSTNKVLSELTEERFLDKKSRLGVLDDWVKELGLPAIEHKKKIADLKVSLFESIKSDEIVEDYDRVLAYVSQEL